MAQQEVYTRWVEFCGRGLCTGEGLFVCVDEIVG